MPFKCSYCGQYFCAQHRLPENHLCPNLPKRGWKEHKSYKEKTKNKDYKTPQTPSNPPEYPWSDQNVSRKTNPKKSGSKSAGIGFVIICLIIIGYIALSDRFGYIQTDENNTSETEPEPGSIESPLSSLFSSQLSYDELVDYTLKLINKERSDRGLNNVTLSPIDSAQKHADDMIKNGYFSHWGLDGKKPSWWSISWVKSQKMW